MMPPIKFQTPTNQWVGVGDRVWCNGYGDPRTGIVTGFEFTPDDGVPFEVVVTHVGDKRGDTEMKLTYQFESVFSSEEACWLEFIKTLTARRDEHVRQTAELDKRINALWKRWVKSP